MEIAIPLIEEERMLHCIRAGGQGFNDRKHLSNFVRYLYGAKSGRHTVNENTKFNTMRKKESGTTFTKSPEELYKKEMENIGEIEFYELESDVIYIPFLMKVDGILVSNFLNTDEDGETYMDMQEGDGELVFEAMCDAYPDGDAEELFLGIDTILEKNNNEFTRYKDLKDEKTRLKIERMLHSVSLDSFPANNLIVSVSHDDQKEHHPDYHIHRLYKVEEEEGEDYELLDIDIEEGSIHYGETTMGGRTIGLITVQIDE